MSLWRYNRLRKRGYRTIRGGNWENPDFGNEWVELIMSNGLKIKKIRINGSVRVGDFIDIENATDNPNAPTRGKEEQLKEVKAKLA